MQFSVLTFGGNEDSVLTPIQLSSYCSALLQLIVKRLMPLDGWNAAE